MIERYILRRDPLIAIVFLLDIRRLPSEEDIGLWIWLQHLEKDIVPVLTKADKLSSQQQKKQAFLIADALDIPHQGVVITSAKDHKGRDRLRDILRAYAWQATLRLRAEEQGALNEEVNASQEPEN
jgi:GTP-binding protein